MPKMVDMLTEKSKWINQNEDETKMILISFTLRICIRSTNLLKSRMSVWHCRRQILDPDTCSGMLGHLSSLDVKQHCEIFRHRRSFLEAFFTHYWEFFSPRSRINKTCRKTYVREARLYLATSWKLSAHSTSLIWENYFYSIVMVRKGPLLPRLYWHRNWGVQACEIDRSHRSLYLQTTDGKDKYGLICEICCFIGCAAFNTHVNVP